MPSRRVAAAVAITLGIPGILGSTGALAGCTGGPAQQPAGPVTIGILADQSSPAGVTAVRAATLAIELINDRHPDLDLPLAGGSGLPGLAGAPVRVAVGDTTGAPGAAEEAVDRLLGEPGLTGLVAADGAEVTATAGAYADRRQVPLVDAATSAGYLPEVGLEWYFRITPSDRSLAEAVFALLAAAPAAGAGSRVTVFTPAAGAGADVVAGLAELAGENGLEITETVPADARAPVRLAATEPDPVVAVAATAGEARRLSQVLAEAGTPRPVVGLGPGFAAASSVPDGMLYPAGWSPELARRHPLASAVLDRYRQRYDTAMSGTAAAVFTATLALATAVDSTGATDPATVRAGLRQLSLPATQTIMPWNGVRFGADGQNQLAAAVVEQRTEDGPVLVYPPELAQAPVSWPSPAPAGEGFP